MTISLRPYVLEGGAGRSIDAEMGTLTVPMSRLEPGRGTVELAFVRLPATAPSAQPPVVFLNGGPGLSGIRAARGRLFPLFDALRAAGDVILLDQRGAGASTPSLACREPLRIPFDQVLTRDDALQRVRESVRRCAGQLARDGVDVRAFHTNESADDVADLARALRVKCISLVAWSYGTHLAFAIMRRHGALVARALLAGPEGPDHTYKLPSCIEQYLVAISARARMQLPDVPDLVATMQHVFAALESAPAEIAMKDAHGAVRRALISRFDLEWMTAEGIADTRMIARLPHWYARMAQGNFGDVALDPVLRAYFEALRHDLGSSLVRVCMDCASGVSRERWHRIEREAAATRLGRMVDFPLPDVCDTVAMPDLGNDFRAPLRSTVPVLFVTGTLDARTPSENAHELIPGLAAARHLSVEDAGHTDLLHAPAVQAAAVRFLCGGEVASAQVPAAQPLQFVPPAQKHSF